MGTGLAKYEDNEDTGYGQPWWHHIIWHSSYGQKVSMATLNMGVILWNKSEDLYL